MKKSDQIGCGYCSREKTCNIHDPKVNKAKQGCKDYIHYLDDPNYKFIKKSATNESV